MKFSEFALSTELQKSIDDLGFTEATEIQEKAIPLLLDHDGDFIGQAQTGTGKTAAFVLPLLEKIDASSRDIQALILTPTRELANQVCEQVAKLSKYSKVKSLPVFGGASYETQIRGIKNGRPQIIVGTPGRVKDLLNKGILKFGSAKFIILDEADEMLNMGFFDDVQEILGRFNEEKKAWMFSATMPRQIHKLIDDNFNNPVSVAVKRKALSNENIEQKYFVIRRRYRAEALCRVIDTTDNFYGIVFCQTKVETAEVGEDLQFRGYKTEILHGDMSQQLRDNAMAKFKSGKVNIMVCTDVAARGIDVTNLTHVVNFGLPRDQESYVHRIGRTGRAGLKGCALSFIDPSDKGKVRRLEMFIKTKLELGKLPEIKEVKKVLIEKEAESYKTLVESITEKGEDFKVDDSFETFKAAFDEIGKEEVLKIIFTKQFNKKLRRLDDLANVETASFERGNDRNSNRRGDRNGRRDDRRSDRRGDRNERRGDRRSDRNERRAERGERNTERHSDRGNRFESGSRDRKDQTLKSDHMRVFVNTGKRDGIHLRGFLQDISREVKIEERSIQNVALKNTFSFFDVPEAVGQKLISKKGMKMNDREIRFEQSSR